MAAAPPKESWPRIQPGQQLRAPGSRGAGRRRVAGGQSPARGAMALTVSPKAFLSKRRPAAGAPGSGTVAFPVGQGHGVSDNLSFECGRPPWRGEEGLSQAHVVGGSGLAVGVRRTGGTPAPRARGGGWRPQVCSKLQRHVLICMRKGESRAQLAAPAQMTGPHPPRRSPPPPRAAAAASRARGSSARAVPRSSP